MEEESPRHVADQRSTHIPMPQYAFHRGFAGTCRVAASSFVRRAGHMLSVPSRRARTSGPTWEKPPDSSGGLETLGSEIEEDMLIFLMSFWGATRYEPVG